MVRFWEQCAADQPGKPLPPVIPLVLYHGERNWQIKSQFRSLIEAPQALDVFVPDFVYQLCDLNRDELNDLRDRTILRIALSVLKYSLSDELPSQLTPILELFRDILKQPDGLSFLRTVLRYLTQATDKVDETTIQQALQYTLPNIGETIMPTIAETFWSRDGSRE